MALGGSATTALLLPGEDPPEASNSASPQELKAHPGLHRLLRDLGGLLGDDGLSPHLQQELSQAEEALGRARQPWLRLELLWRLLEELIRDPRDFDPSALLWLQQELTWAQVRRGPPEIAELAPRPQLPRTLPRLLLELERRLQEKWEELQNYLLGPPKNLQNPPQKTPNPQIPQNPPKIPSNLPKIPHNLCKIPPNPPKIPPQIPQKPPKIPQIISKIPQIPPKIPTNPSKIPQNPPKIPQIPQGIAQIPPKIPQIPPKISQVPPEIPPNPPKIPQFPPKIPPEILEMAEKSQISPNLGLVLGWERQRLQQEQLRERLLQERLERVRREYPQVLGRCLSQLSRAHSLGSLQAHLDGGRGRYLLAKGEALLLKIRLEELQVLLDTYPAPTVEAHRQIRAGLTRGRQAAETEAAILGVELEALRELGPEFRELALELGRIREESARKRGVLRQLHPAPPL